MTAFKIGDRVNYKLSREVFQNVVIESISDNPFGTTYQADGGSFFEFWLEPADPAPAQATQQQPSRDSIITALLAYAKTITPAPVLPAGTVVNIDADNLFFKVGVIVSHGLDDDGDYKVAIIEDDGTHDYDWYASDELTAA